MLRRREGSGSSGPPRLPGPLLESCATAADLLPAVRAFVDARREHHDALKAAEDGIRAAYLAFPAGERAKFFSMVYDIFADGYDTHMESTGHYRAIKRVLGYAAPFLRFPMLDITAGSGVPLGFALEIAKEEAGGVRVLRPDVVANEISPRMALNMFGRLEGVELSSFDAGWLPDSFSGRFGTVLCSQTFHLVSDEDKLRIVRSMHRALAPGGFAVVMEEDPFRITPTPEIDMVSMFLRAVVCPIKHRGTLIAYFENNGFTRLEERAVAPIDEHHSMRLHVFMKP